MHKIYMSHPEECIADIRWPYFHDSSFIRLKDGSVMHHAGHRFSISKDKGMTWSKPYVKKDANGDLVGKGNSSLVNLSGGGIGLHQEGSPAGCRSWGAPGRSDRRGPMPAARTPAPCGRSRTGQLRRRAPVPARRGLGRGPGSSSSRRRRPATRA